MPSQHEIITAYRHSLRAGLRAVLYSKPARFTIRDHVRAAFRNGQPADLDPVRLSRTLEFLGNAARYRGLEHRIVRNMCHVSWDRKFRVPHQISPEEYPIKQHAFDAYERTIANLNDSMGLCLR